MPNTNEPNDPNAKGRAPGAERIKPNAEHSYGGESESVNEQFKAMSVSDDVAELKREVQRLKERLAAVEAELEQKTGKSGS
jgi:ubiquinone biosynthesis protein UbiJ